MLAFWPSDAVLVGAQAALVCGPRPRLPKALLRMRSGLWGWLLLPGSLGGTIAVLALVPGLGLTYAWLALIGVPCLAAIALAAALPTSTSAHSRAITAAASSLLLFMMSWVLIANLLGQAAAVALEGLSACALASYLAALAPRIILQLGLVAMAILDAILVFGHLLQGPNDTLNAATPGLELPHLQVALFGSALMGYGDLFAAAVLGHIVSDRAARLMTAGVVVVCSAIFDLLFLAVATLPATVPVAVAMLLVEGWASWRRARLRTP